MLLNANHPRDRRTQSASHETGHMIATRRVPEILHGDGRENSREERYANAFGRAFLTPARAVMQKFHDVTAGSDRLSRRHIIVLAHFFGVSREAIVRRLEELRLTKPGSWDWFQANGGVTDEASPGQVLGDLVTPDVHKADADRPTTLRLNLLANEAYRRGLLSEGQLARLLHLDRVELREILDTQEVEEERGRMASLTCLTDPAAIPLVIDASTVINLNASGCAKEIVKALPNRLAVTHIVPGELESGRNRG